MHHLEHSEKIYICDTCKKHTCLHRVGKRYIHTVQNGKNLCMHCWLLQFNNSISKSLWLSDA